MHDVRPVLFVLGLLMVILAVAMLAPAAVDALAGGDDWHAFVGSSAVAGFFGVALALANRQSVLTLDLRQAYLITASSWIATSALAALPFVLTGTTETYTDAFFESVSGITTTGASVLSGLDSLPAGIQLWRGLLQGLGGIGIIGIAVAVLPALGVGGLQLFRTESSDRSEKVLPRMREILGAIGSIYLIFTAICGTAYWLQGMTPLEAAIHAMTTVSTGGFSTSDASLGHFESRAIHWTAIVFMIIGALPFTLYIQVVRGRPAALWRDQQVRSFIGFITVVVLALTVWLALSRGMPLLDALNAVAFNVVSVVTTTGYATADYGLWGPLAVALFFLLMFVGGCTGSTSGGIKAFRFEVMFLVMRGTLRRLLSRNVVLVTAYNGRPLPDDVLGSVMAFVFTYLMTVGLLGVALAATGLDFLTSLSGAATAVGNVGPGLGEIIGPVGNYSTMPLAAKWLLTLGMLLGRLELFTVLVLFTATYWRR